MRCARRLRLWPRFCRCALGCLGGGTGCGFAMGTGCKAGFSGAVGSPLGVGAEVETSTTDAARSCGGQVIIPNMTVTETAASIATANRIGLSDSDCDAGCKMLSSTFRRLTQSNSLATYMAQIPKKDRSPIRHGASSDLIRTRAMPTPVAIAKPIRPSFDKPMNLNYISKRRVVIRFNFAPALGPAEKHGGWCMLSPFFVNATVAPSTGSILRQITKTVGVPHSSRFWKSAGFDFRF
jgi:hypothetical protein